MGSVPPTQPKAQHKQLAIIGTAVMTAVPIR